MFARLSSAPGMALVPAALLFVLGCATAPMPESTYELEPLVLEAQGQKVVEVDARERFQVAADAYARGRHGEALRLFEDVARLFPESKFAPHALYNAGLALVQLQRFDEALSVLADAREQLADDEDRFDALCQIGTCYEGLGRWQDVRGVMRQVLTRKSLNVRDRVEARIRLGLAFHRMGDWAQAERELDLALDEHRKNPGIPSLKSNPWVARAQFVIGEMYRELFRSIQFRLPVESMERDLSDKSSFFLKAQTAYLQAIRLSTKPWSVGAGFRLGELYEAMVEDMMKAEIPADMDETDRGIYFDELKKYVKPMVERAVDIYQRALQMNDRLGGTEEWSKASEAGLDRMQRMLEGELRERSGE